MQKDLAMDVDRRPESDGQEDRSTATDRSLVSSRNSAVLRVECISGKTIKVSVCNWNMYDCSMISLIIAVQRFLFIQFWLRWIVFGIWVFFAVMSYRRSFYFENEAINLHLATALSTMFSCITCLALGCLLRRMLKVWRAQQIW